MGKRRQDPKTNFGWYLRRLMDAKGYESDADLDKVSGVDASLISKWQAGGKASLENLRKVAPHLGVRLGDLLVEAGMATPEELGMVGKPPKLPPAVVDPGLREASEILESRHVPDADKDELRELVGEAVGYWRRRRPTPGPHEPSHTERAQGRSVSKR